MNIWGVCTVATIDDVVINEWLPDTEPTPYEIDEATVEYACGERNELPPDEREDNQMDTEEIN